MQKLIDTVFNGSAESLVLTLLNAGPHQALSGPHSAIDQQNAREEIMNRFHEFGIVIFAQLTGITLAAALLAGLARRHAANRHAIGLIALVLTLASPALALALPRPAWWNVLTSPTERVRASADAPESEWPTEPTFVAPAEGSFDPVPEEPHVTSAPSNARLDSRPAPIPVPLAREPVPARLPAPAPPASRSNWLNWALHFAVGTWLAGVVVLAFRLARSQRGLRQLRFSFENSMVSRVEFPGSGLLDSVSQTLGVRQRPALAGPQESPLPMLFGLWRLVIVSPRELATSAPQAACATCWFTSVHTSSAAIRG